MLRDWLFVRHFGYGRHCWRPLLLSGGLLLIAPVSGCGEANPLGRRPIYGAVSFQGKPLESGWVRFEPNEPSGVNSAGQIEAGKYHIQ